mmetsp:Transcript_5824/g.13756  ORF Transcript_5824/g.13756 Transcript_5824/m.13756 type:complete len:265 (-) Transcript_5824:20-814(-)
MPLGEAPTSRPCSRGSVNRRLSSSGSCCGTPLSAHSVSRSASSPCPRELKLGAPHWRQARVAILSTASVCAEGSAVRSVSVVPNTAAACAQNCASSLSGGCWRWSPAWILLATIAACCCRGSWSRSSKASFTTGCRRLCCRRLVLVPCTVSISISASTSRSHRPEHCESACSCVPTFTASGCRDTRAWASRAPPSPSLSSCSISVLWSQVTLLYPQLPSSIKLRVAKNRSCWIAGPISSAIRRDSLCCLPWLPSLPRLLSLSPA